MAVTKRTARKTVGPRPQHQLAPRDPPLPSSPSASSSSSESLPDSVVGFHSYPVDASPPREWASGDEISYGRVMEILEMGYHSDDQPPLTINRRVWLSDELDSDFDEEMENDSETAVFLPAATSSSHTPVAPVQSPLPSPSYSPATPVFSSPSYTPAAPVSSPSYTPATPVSSPSYSPATPASSPSYIPGDPSPSTGSR